MSKERPDRTFKKFKIGAAAVMVSLSSFSLYKAIAATATLPVIARLIGAVEMTLSTSLDFGTLAMTDDRPGRATIDPFTDQLFVDGHSSLTAAGGVPRAGRLQVRGTNKPITISFDEPTVRLTNGTTFLTVKDFNFGPTAQNTQITVTPEFINDTVLVNVGASVETRKGQLTGVYVGSNRIFAHFQ